MYPPQEFTQQNVSPSLEEYTLAQKTKPRSEQQTWGEAGCVKAFLLRTLSCKNTLRLEATMRSKQKS